MTESAGQQGLSAEAAAVLAVLERESVDGLTGEGAPADFRF